MDKSMKQNIILLVIIITMLLVNIIYTIWQTIDYEQRKDSGNDHWKQVENMIIDNKKQIEEIKGEIENVY